MGASDCEDEFRQFVEDRNPLLPHQHRQRTSPTTILSLWDGGMMAMLTAASQTDLVIALGCGSTGFSCTARFSPGKARAGGHQPCRDRPQPGRRCGSGGGCSTLLKSLIGFVEEKRHDAWLKGLKDIYMPMTAEETAAQNTPSDPIHPHRLIALTREAAGDDAIYIIDGGDTSYYGAVGLKAKERAAVYASAGGQFGCLGTGIPFALAAKLARPDKQVVLINGDGSFGLNALEFDTAVRHDIPILCIVNNDQAWGMIKHGQELCYGGERVIGSHLGAVRYDKVVEALGGYGELVEKDADLLPAIKRALASGKPACVNVMTDTCAISPMTLQFIDGLKME